MPPANRKEKKEEQAVNIWQRCQRVPAPQIASAGDRHATTNEGRNFALAAGLQEIDCMHARGGGGRAACNFYTGKDPNRGWFQDLISTQLPGIRD